MNRAVFVDRDDTLIENVPYLSDPKRVKLLPYARETLEQLKNNGFLIFMITNQSGVGRGWITEEQVNAVNEEVIRQLGENYFTKIYCCYDDPNDPVENCRKPSPRMIFWAGTEYNIELLNSFFIGDRLADVEAGNNAGCKTVYVQTGSHKEEQREASQKADFVAKNLFAAAEWIINNRVESE